MKVAIVTDYLLERDDVVRHVELFLHMYPDASIHTLAHNRGHLGGLIESQTIYSTFMSEQVNDLDSFLAKNYLIPSALKQIDTKDSELIIILSSGFSHQLEVKKSEHTIIYFYQNKSPKLRGIKRLLFSKFLFHFKVKPLGHSPLMVKSSKSLNFNFITQNIIPPVLKIDDYPFNENKSFDFNYYLVKYSLEQHKNILKLIRLFASLNLSLGIFGKVPGKLKNMQSDSLLFFDYDCSGFVNEYMENCRAYIELEDVDIPSQALGCLATGRPVIIQDTPLSKEYFSEQTATFFKDHSSEGLKNAILTMEQRYLLFERKKLRRHALRYNGRIFKTRFFGLIERFLRPKSSQGPQQFS